MAAFLDAYCLSVSGDIDAMRRIIIFGRDFTQLSAKILLWYRSDPRNIKRQRKYCRSNHNMIQAIEDLNFVRRVLFARKKCCMFNTIVFAYFR